MDTNILSSQVFASMAIIYAMNWLKKQEWFPWISYESSKVNHWVAVIVTGLSTLGIHFVWNSSNHSLTITGLNAITISTTAYQWLQQYLMTKTGYIFLKGNLRDNDIKEITTGDVKVVKTIPTQSTLIKTKTPASDLDSIANRDLDKKW